MALSQNHEFPGYRGGDSADGHEITGQAPAAKGLSDSRGTSLRATLHPHTLLDARRVLETVVAGEDTRPHADDARRVIQALGVAIHDCCPELAEQFGVPKQPET